MRVKLMEVRTTQDVVSSPSIPSDVMLKGYVSGYWWTLIKWSILNWDEVNCKSQLSQRHRRSILPLSFSELSVCSFKNGLWYSSICKSNIYRDGNILSHVKHWYSWNVRKWFWNPSWPYAIVEQYGHSSGGYAGLWVVYAVSSLFSSRLLLPIWVVRLNRSLVVWEDCDVSRKVFWCRHCLHNFHCFRMQSYACSYVTQTSNTKEGSAYVLPVYRGL